jgi:hypothetical protein
MGGDGAGFMRLPSVFWFGHSDMALLTVAWIAFVLSLVLVAGYANALLSIWRAVYMFSPGQTMNTSF